MDTTETISLRERKKIQTHIDLANNALELFHQHGYENVTVEDISAAVNVSPRTFFRYFRTKEDVLFPNEAETAADFHKALMARPEDEPVLVAARNALIDLADAFDHRAAHIRTRNTIIAKSPALRSRELEQLARLEEMLAEVVATRMGISGRELGPRVIAATSVAGIRAAIDFWLEADEDVHLVDIATSVLDGLDRGLRHFAAHASNPV